MNTLYDKISQWNQNVKGFKTSESLSDLNSKNRWTQLWNLHIEGQEYRLKLTQNIVCGETQSVIKEAEQCFMFGELRLHQYLNEIPLASWQNEDIETRIQNLQDQLDHLYLDTQINDRDELIQVIGIVHELRFIKRLTSHLSDQVDSYQADLINEIFNKAAINW